MNLSRIYRAFRICMFCIRNFVECMCFSPVLVEVLPKNGIFLFVWNNFPCQEFITVCSKAQKKAAKEVARLAEADRARLERQARKAARQAVRAERSKAEARQEG
jgi:hypothetical protein